MQIGRDLLSGPTRQAAAAFSVVADLLAEVRAALTDLCKRLRELDEVLAAQSGNGQLIEMVEGAVEIVRSAVQEAASRASPQKTNGAIHDALSKLDQIRTCAREIDAVASLTSVTSQSIGLTSFVDYVISLRRLVETMRKDAAEMSGSIMALQSRRIRAVEQFDRAMADILQVGEILQEVASERIETDRLLQRTLSEVNSLASSVPSETTTHIEVLMRAMQFSDALAQRLDHVGMLLGTQDAPADTTGPLARAQIEALVAETTDIAEDARRSLSQIRSLADRVAHVIGSDTDSPAGRTLKLGREILAKISDRIQSAFEAIDCAEHESRDLCDYAESARARFASVISATDAMHIHAINAALLARQGASTQGAMSVLSVEVQSKASECANLAKRCDSAIREVSLPEDLAAFAAVAPVAAAFRNTIDSTSAAVGTASLASSTLEHVQANTVTALSHLATATQTANDAISAIHASASQLTEVARLLPNSLPANCDPLLGLMDIYSMEAERNVHRRLFGLAETQAKTPPPVATDDDLLAAIMF